MHEYKINYKNRRTQTVKADSYERRGDTYDFFRNRQLILSLDADAVESVGLADIAEPSGPDLSRTGV